MTQGPPVGEFDLTRILATLDPVVRDGEFVFVSVPNDLPDVPAEAVVRESEGVTYVVRREVASQRGWPYDFVAAWVTLSVHSDLAAVGLTAAVSSALANAGLSCNLLAGYFHDHLLVPVDRVDEVLAVLRELAQA